ncbi:MAG: hypothetical protein HRU15_10890 [Planctomycetes bacterium]|nr:hypothetical protein [Planctomycetota bacterium]
MKDSITTSVSFTQNPQQHTSEWMMNRSIAHSVQLLQNLTQLPQFPYIKNMAYILGILVLLSLLFVTPITSTYLQRACAPWANIPRHSDIQFIVYPEQLGVSRGSNILIEIHSLPLQKDLQAVLLWQDGHSESRKCINDDKEGTFYLNLGPIIQTCTVHFQSGESASKRYAIEVHATPQVSNVKLEIKAPQHNSQQENEQLHGGDAHIIAGSQITFHADVSDTHIQRARLISGEHWQQELDLSQTGSLYHINGSWQGEQSLLYQLEIYDKQGVRSLYPQEWSLTVAQDQYPQLSINHHHGPIIHKLNTLQLHLQAHDDTGIESIQYSLLINNELISKNYLPINESSPDLEQDLKIPLSIYNLQSGDHLTCTTVITDHAGQKSTSSPMQWSVVTNKDHLWEPAHKTFGAFHRRFTFLQTMTLELRRRWRDLDDNFRLDELIAQRATLLIHDQQSRHIISELQILEEQLLLLSSTFDKSLSEQVAIIRKKIHFANQLAESSLSNRGAYILSTNDKKVIPVLIRQSIDDSDDFGSLLTHIEKHSATLQAYIQYQYTIAHIDANKNHQQRLKESLIAELAWNQSSYQDRLSCSIFANTNFSGKPLNQQSRAIRINNSTIPEHGLENFSIHWSGDIYIPEDGTWLITSTSDDGIKCSINDKDMFPGAWTEQAAKKYSSRVKLTKGWQQLHIRYFQGLGDSVLNMQIGLTTESMKDINSMSFRSSNGSINEHSIKNSMIRIPYNNIQSQYNKFIRHSYRLYDFQDALSNASHSLHNPTLNRLIDKCLELCEQQHSATSLLKKTTPQIDSLLSIPNDFEKIQRHLLKCIQIIDHQWKSNKYPLYIGLKLDTFISYLQHVLRSVSIYENWEASYESFIRAHRLAERQLPQLWKFQASSLEELKAISNNNHYSLETRNQALEKYYSIQKLSHSALKDIDLHDKSSIWKLKNILQSLQKYQRELICIRWNDLKKYSQELLESPRQPRELDFDDQLIAMHNNEIQELVLSYAIRFGIVEFINILKDSNKTTLTKSLANFHKLLKPAAKRFNTIHSLQHLVGAKTQNPNKLLDMIRESLLNAESSANAGKLSQSYQDFFLAMKLHALSDTTPSNKWLQKLMAEMPKVLLNDSTLSHAYLDLMKEYQSDEMNGADLIQQCIRSHTAIDYQTYINGISHAYLTTHTAEKTSSVNNAPKIKYPASTINISQEFQTATHVLNSIQNDMLLHHKRFTAYALQAHKDMGLITEDFRVALQHCTPKWKSQLSPVFTKLEKTWDMLAPVRKDDSNDEAEKMQYQMQYQAQYHLQSKVLAPLSQLVRNKINFHHPIDQNFILLCKRLSRIHYYLDHYHTIMLDHASHSIDQYIKNTSLLAKNQPLISPQIDHQDPLALVNGNNTVSVKKLTQKIKKEIHTACQTTEPLEKNMQHANQAVESISALKSLLFILEPQQQLQALLNLCEQQKLLFDHIRKRSPETLFSSYNNGVVGKQIIDSYQKCHHLLKQLNQKALNRLSKLSLQAPPRLTDTYSLAIVQKNIYKELHLAYQEIIDSSSDEAHTLRACKILFQKYHLRLFSHAIRCNNISENDTNEAATIREQNQDQFIRDSEKHRIDIESRFQAQREEVTSLVQQQGYYINKQFFSLEQQRIIDDYFTRLAEGKK